MKNYIMLGLTFWYQNSMQIYAVLRNIGIPGNSILTGLDKTLIYNIKLKILKTSQMNVKDIR